MIALDDSILAMHFTGGTSWAPTTLQVAIADGSGNEPTAGDYARFDLDPAEWSLSYSGSAPNITATMTYPLIRVGPVVANAWGSSTVIPYLVDDDDNILARLGTTAPQLSITRQTCFEVVLTRSGFLSTSAAESFAEHFTRLTDFTPTTVELQGVMPSSLTNAADAVVATGWSWDAGTKRSVWDGCEIGAAIDNGTSTSAYRVKLILDTIDFVIVGTNPIPGRTTALSCNQDVFMYCSAQVSMPLWNP